LFLVVWISRQDASRTHHDPRTSENTSKSKPQREAIRANLQVLRKEVKRWQVVLKKKKKKKDFKEPNRDGLQPKSDGLQATIDGLQPRRRRRSRRIEEE